MELPEPEYRRSLRLTAAKLEGIGARLDATMLLRDEQGHAQAIPLSSCWQPLPGREGVMIFHIPNPSGEGGLYMTVFATEEGAHYQGSIIDESRLLTLLEGHLECNGIPYQPGEMVWLGPNESTSWFAHLTCLGVVRYNVPKPTKP